MDSFSFQAVIFRKDGDGGCQRSSSCHWTHLLSYCTRCCVCRSRNRLALIIPSTYVLNPVKYKRCNPAIGVTVASHLYATKRPCVVHHEPLAFPPLLSLNSPETAKGNDRSLRRYSKDRTSQLRVPINVSPSKKVIYSPHVDIITVSHCTPAPRGLLPLHSSY
jgi:hypothetical protein